MARTSFKVVEEINIKENIFHEKHKADMQGELDLCGNTLGDQVDVSTIRTDVRGAEKSSGKEAHRERIPSFLIFFCFFLSKRGSM